MSGVPGEGYQLLRLETGIIFFMLRAALFALLVVSVLNGSLQAQRAGATFYSGGTGRMPIRSAFGGSRGISNRLFSNRSNMHHDRFTSGFVPYYFPYNELFGGEQPEVELNETVPSVVILQPDERPSREPETLAPKPLVIEIPGAASSTTAKMLQPTTIFILAHGERLEARRFVLTASTLSVSIDRQQRTVPIDMLDINATITANHERGIDLRIPADPGEISLSF